MKNIIYLVYPGLGKTYGAKIDKRILEVQYNNFYNLNRRKLGEHFPENKKMNLNLEVEVDPEFPENILNYINNGLKENKFPVMALKPQNIDFCIKYNYDFAFLLPSKERQAKLKEDYIKRGNTIEYIERNMKALENLENEISKYNKRIYYLNSDEYLIDFINKMVTIWKLKI